MHQSRDLLRVEKKLYYVEIIQLSRDILHQHKIRKKPVNMET
jgi:hypothetical protein